MILHAQLRPLLLNSRTPRRLGESVLQIIVHRERGVVVRQHTRHEGHAVHAVAKKRTVQSAELVAQ